MSSTIRTYRHSPDYATDPTGTLVDTETDADDGPFTVTVDTTGWSAGNYQVTATREYTTGGLSESAKSNALAVTANVAGNSYDFTGSAGALPSPWADLSSSSDANYTVSQCELDGSGHGRGTGNYAQAGARYTTSTSDISQIVIKAKGTPATSSDVGPCLRSDGHSYYRVKVYGATGTSPYYYSNVNIYRYTPTDASEQWVSGGTYTGDNGADHTVRFEASGSGATITLSVTIDSTPITMTPSGDTHANRITTAGNPGWAAYPFGNQNNSLVDDWQDF